MYQAESRHGIRELAEQDLDDDHGEDEQSPHDSYGDFAKNATISAIGGPMMS